MRDGAIGSAMLTCVAAAVAAVADVTERAAARTDIFTESPMFDRAGPLARMASLRKCNMLIAYPIALRQACVPSGSRRDFAERVPSAPIPAHRGGRAICRGRR